MPTSALFGTKLCDDFFGVRAGGDIAFIHGVLKELTRAADRTRRSSRDHTEGFETLAAHVNGLSWRGDLDAGSGLGRVNSRVSPTGTRRPRPR